MPPQNRPHISVVSPVYRAEKIVDELVAQVESVLQRMGVSYEIVLVDDRSPDGSWARIQAIAAQNRCVRGLRLSRNFGQHYAITCGLDHALGEWVVVMDCDLQDRPDEIPALYAKAQEGWDVVLAQRVQRQDSPGKRFFSWAFYRTLSYLVGERQDHRVANFGIYSAAVVTAVRAMREPTRYFPTMVRWVGFRRIAIPVRHAERFEGKTTYNLKRLLRLAEDIILAYSDKPLRLLVRFGVLLATLAFLGGGVVVGLHLAGHFSVTGWASLMATLLFGIGLIIATIGMVGLYVGKVFDAAKQRPIYLVAEWANGGNDNR
jgi:dolichol-phosphate mannosyltransferase